jgi:hypothetical protein
MSIGSAWMSLTMQSRRFFWKLPSSAVEILNLG